MFGSVVVSDYVYETLAATSGVTNIIPATQFSGAMVAAQGMALPVAIFHMTYSEYGGVLDSTPAANVNSETVRLEVRFIDAGTSDSVIYPAAAASFAALAGVNVSHVFDGTTYTLTFAAIGEVPLGTLMDGAQIYRQLGTVYSVDVFRA